MEEVNLLPVADSKLLGILIRHDMVERAVGLPTGFLVMDNSMPVTERSPLHILPAQPDMVAFQ